MSLILEGLSTYRPRNHSKGLFVNRQMLYVHARGAAGDSASLLQAVHLSVAGLLGLALHVVIVVLAASGANEEGGGQQRSRAGTDFLDGGNILWKRSGVDEDLLVEPVYLGKKEAWLAFRSTDGWNANYRPIARDNGNKSIWYVLRATSRHFC